MSHRISDGTKVNQWGKTGEKTATYQDANGKCRYGAAKRPSHHDVSAGERRMNGEVQPYNAPALANPGNLIDVKVGGGHMGSMLAHENEAPFPEDLAAWFLRSLCPPGGTVLDPFGGSGTTVAAAEKNGRHGVALDLRQSQCRLAMRRVEESLRPHIPRPKRTPRPVRPDQSLLF